MQRNSKPLTWRPKGASDTLDATDTFTGAMSSLQNLIPDPSTRGLWQCRPAAEGLVLFGGTPWSTGFSSGFGVVLPGAGFISLLKIIGDVAYMLIASSLNPGNDQPFAINLLTGVVVSVNNILAANTPTSPATSGDWEPPTAELVGSNLVVTHPGFTGAGGVYFGWFDLSNPLFVTWNGGNLSGAVQFTFPPSAVKQFNGRAYYIQNLVAQPAVIFSDSLNATNVTNANQIITFGDNVTLTALGALPLQNQLGGIIQALIVFKGVQNIYQITGDAALSNLSVNSLNTATGTLAPNTVCQTPKGLVFVAPDGVRLIDYFANVGDPIGYDGQGVTIPFVYSVVPSRMTAACNGTTLRISTQNGNVAGHPFQEWWYDLAREIWYGPHTLPASLISSWGTTFVMSPVNVLAELFRSDIVQSAASVFIEHGAQLSWSAVTPMMPDLDQMTTNAITETTWELALVSTTPADTVTAKTQNGTTLDTLSISVSASIALSPIDLSWHFPIVFNRIAFGVTGQSAAGIKVGTLRMRYQMLRQLQNVAAVVS